MNEAGKLSFDLSNELKIPKKDNIGGFSTISKKTVNALRQGSHEAYDEIFLAFYQPIKKFLVYLTKSEDDAEDFAQQVFMQLWEKRESIDHNNNLRGFLYNVARNLTFNNFEHRKVIGKYLEFQGRGFDLDLSPDEIIAGKELQILIELAISNMPPQRQKIIRLKFEEDKSNDEIAQMLGLRPETVRVHVAKGKQDLQNFINLFVFFFAFA